jgi:CheY-like chemotaxis protein
MSAQVLIADGDAERGRGIAEACTARGLECRVTMHGAAALEAALSEVPQVLIGQLGLPLIDGPTLAAILHANPRTQGVEVLFLGDRPGDVEAFALGGQLIPPPVDPAVVAGCVQTVLGERGAGDASPAAPGEEGGVEGQLAQLPLADLLQLFHVSRKTGTVEVVHGLGPARRQTGRVVLRGGEVVAAAVGSVDGEKALFRLLAWERGSFVFKPGPAAIEPSIQAPTRALLREGVRQIREWQRLAVDLPPLSAGVALKIPRSTLPNVIHPLTQEVLVVLDLYSRVQDVVDKCSYPDYQVLRTLHTLVQRGMVELQREPEATELAAEVRLFSPARTARLREWLQVDRPTTPTAREAKLLVVASDANATRDFCRLFQRLPGVELDSRIERGRLASDDLLTIGRVAVDAQVGIDLVHVPAAERFAPLWPVAGHGALATLLLLSGAVGPAVASVRTVAQALGALPHARIFHLLLLEKGERVSPEDLRQNLSIVDDGSLFLIPLESPEKAGVLLREMFGRILP